MKPKYGIHIEPLFGFDYKTIENIAQYAEKIGYDSIWVCDHFFRDENAVDTNSLEAWTLLTALATATTQMRLGTLVSGNLYRHPALLAKIAATLDMISGGRLFFGIGAGWKESEHKAYGIHFPGLNERFERFEEALQVIIKLWTEDRADFEGVCYQLKQAVFAPKPVQDPYPPILVGGHGEKKTMRLVAEYADMSNFTPWASERIERVLAALRSHCEDTGRDYASITKSFLGYCMISDDEKEIKLFNSIRAKEQGISLESYLENQSSLPGRWAGSVDEVIQQYSHLINLGFSYFQVQFPYGKEIETSRRFMEEVIPSL